MSSIFTDKDIDKLNEILYDSHFLFSQLNEFEDFRLIVKRPDFKRKKRVEYFCFMKVTQVLATISELEIKGAELLEIVEKIPGNNWNRNGEETIYSISYINQLILLDTEQFLLKIRAPHFSLVLKDIEKTNEVLLRLSGWI